MIPIPVVETERLILRPWRADDLGPWAAIMADPDVTRLIGGPQSRSESWWQIARTIGHWFLRDFGFWAVERKDDGVLIGRIGLQNPEGWPGMEVGWTLGRRFWGQGYATEAAQASLDYGFRNFSVDRLISLIDPVNVQSQRVATRIGETKGEATTITVQGKTYVVDIWSITRERWQSR